MAKKRKQRQVIYGNNIKAIMQESEMEQNEFAEKMDIDAAHASRLIKGKKPQLSLVTAFKISHVLNKPIEEIFIYKKPGEK